MLPANRQTDHDSEEHDAPHDALRAEERCEAFCDHVCAAAFREQFSEHRAEADERGDAAERLPEADGKKLGDGEHCQRLLRAGRRDFHRDCTRADEQGGEREGDECVHLEPRDEHDEQHDGCEREGDECPVLGGHGRVANDG